METKTKRYLTEDEVRAIRTLHRYSNKSQKNLSKLFKCSQACISNIVRKRSHREDTSYQPPVAPESIDRNAVCNLRDKGCSYIEIVKRIKAQTGREYSVDYIRQVYRDTK